MKKRKKVVHQHISSNKSHILIKKGLVGYGILVFTFFFLAAFAIAMLWYGLHMRENSVRRHRIEAIYQSLELGDDYRIAKSDIFGDKRVYSWDKSRSFSSSVEYGRNANVSETFDDLKTHIEAAGFKQIEGPNYGAAARQDHYRNDQGEYIRVSVWSKAFSDAIVYGSSMPEPHSPKQTEIGPAYVTIKVNLDDNNE